MLKKLFGWCQGRHTFFATAFFIAGNLMHWFHRLDSTYIGYMTALMTFVTGHAIQENVFGKKDGTPDVPQKDEGKDVVNDGDAK